MQVQLSVSYRVFGSNLATFSLCHGAHSSETKGKIICDGIGNWAQAELVQDRGQLQVRFNVASTLSWIKVDGAIFINHTSSSMSGGCVRGGGISTQNANAISAKLQ